MSMYILHTRLLRSSPSTARRRPLQIDFGGGQFEAEEHEQKPVYLFQPAGVAARIVQPGSDGRGKEGDDNAPDGAGGDENQPEQDERENLVGTRYGNKLG